jgi:integrase
MPLLYQAIQAADTKPCHTGKPLAQNTRHDYHIILKPFLIWMIDNNINTHLDEKKIKNIKNPGVNSNTTHPDDILEPKEILSMIAACRSSRDRALIAVQYEGATRIGELGRMVWRDVVFDEYGARIIIDDTKTKKKRQARLTNESSARYLATWRDDYPGVPEGEAPVFLSERGGPLSYYAMRKIFINAAKVANTEKKIKTHLFRKSRGTHLIEQGLPISNVIELMWANQGTRMIDTYIQMSPVEQDRIMLKHAGLISDEQSKAKERRISGTMCPLCHYQNSPTARYCAGCGVGMTEEAVKKHQMTQEFLKNPDIMMEMMQEMIENNYARMK